MSIPLKWVVFFGVPGFLCREKIQGFLIRLFPIRIGFFRCLPAAGPWLMQLLMYALRWVRLAAIRPQPRESFPMAPGAHPRSAIPLATPIMKGIPNYSPVGKGLFRVCSSSVCWNNLRTWGFWCHPPKKLTWQAGLNPQLEDVYIYIWECWSIYIEHGTKQKMSCFSFLGWFITWWFMAVGN